MLKQKHMTKICFNTSKEVEEKIIRLAEKEISATKSSIINKILIEFLNKNKERE